MLEKPNDIEYDDILGMPEEQNLSEFNQALLNGWHEFIQGKEPETIRPTILSSWKRCRAAQVDPYQFEYSFLDEVELQQMLAANQDLILVAHNIMQNLLAFNPDGHINLTSASGVTLAYCGLDLTPIGSILTEPVLGTNSTARCLREQRLVYTASCENWKIALRERNQHCAAAPIKHQDGSLLGVLTLTGTRGSFNHHTMGTVKAAAEAIEQQLILRRLISEQQSILETLNEGVLVFDSTGQIKTVNRYARQVIGSKSLVGRHIDKALKPEEISLLEMPPCNDKEVVFLPDSVQRLPCLISLTDTADGSRVLSLRENQRIRAITRRVMGAGASYTFERIIGDSPQLLSTLQKARTCSRNDSTVLLTGESGTGKELFAQAIHNASIRNNGPFIAVNCGAIPRDLVQSELFGYVDGAYTGARSGGAPGKFELADGGTLFLDEIGEMPLEAQTSLLRVLQEGEVVRIGSVKPVKLNVRVIAATNCNLMKMVEMSSFRRDLYYRLNVISIQIPALRERTEDIRKLVLFFTERISNSMKRITPEFTTQAMEGLCQYQWPGNVRELENIVERIINLNPGLIIDRASLPDELLANTAQPGNDLIREELSLSTISAVAHTSLESQEKSHIIQLMTLNKGNIRKTSSELGISRPSLYKKLKKWHVDIAQFR